MDFDFLSTLSTAEARLKILKWRELEIGAVFQVLDIVDITTDPSKVYAVFETESQETINVWITPIMHEELKRYDISEGAVYIKPLGTKLSNTTGREYFNFTIVIDPMVSRKNYHN